VLKGMREHNTNFLAALWSGMASENSAKQEILRRLRDVRQVQSVGGVEECMGAGPPAPGRGAFLWVS
jgi:hypothetical protein